MYIIPFFNNHFVFLSCVEIPLQSDPLRPFANRLPRSLENAPLVLKTKTKQNAGLCGFYPYSLYFRF